MNTPNQSSSNPSGANLGSTTPGVSGNTGQTAANTSGQPGAGAANSAGLGSSSNSSPSSNATLNELQDKATALAKEATSQGQAGLDQYRQSAVGQVETLAESARAAADALKTNDTLGLSHYVSDVADGMLDFAGKLRGKSVDELIHDASDLARNNPTLFIAGSIAIGFGLTRFVKASNAARQAHTAAASPAEQPGGGRTAIPSATDQQRSASGFRQDF
ncbi:MAG: hypothetical protein ABWY06_06700 [Pseudomonas sp.]|uniref:hypothetical protein n=1 Tax=Pseudomonas sp. TaxID=306 RepID=UPI00339095C9